MRKPQARCTSSFGKTVTLALIGFAKLSSAMALFPAQPPTQVRTVSPQRPGAEPIAFEVASIRPSGPEPALVPGQRTGNTNECRPPSSIQIDPKRLTVRRVSLYTLIGWAYGRFEIHKTPDGRMITAMSDCTTRNAFNLLSGGPGWLKSELWDVQAVLPDDSFAPDELRSGQVPKLQRMLQTLLADRFSLAIKRESRQMPVYLLTVGKNGPKFNGRRRTGPMKTYDANGNLVSVEDAEVKDTWRVQLAGRRDGKSVGTLDVWNTPLTRLAPDLSDLAGRLILDRTGIAGDVTFNIAWPRADDSRSAAPGALRPGGPALSKAFEEIGLQLEDATAAVEVWIVERATKPSEN